MGGLWDAEETEGCSLRELSEVRMDDIYDAGTKLYYLLKFSLFLSLMDCLYPSGFLNTPITTTQFTIPSKCVLASYTMISSFRI